LAAIPSLSSSTGHDSSMTALMLNKRKRSSDAVSDSGTCHTEQTEASTPRREVDEKYGLVCGAAVPGPLQLHLQQLHVMILKKIHVCLQITAAGTEAGAACSTQVAGVLHCVSSKRLSLHLLGMHTLHCLLMSSSCSLYKYWPWVVEFKYL
jgi:hypothetical protein